MIIKIIVNLSLLIFSSCIYACSGINAEQFIFEANTAYKQAVNEVNIQSSVLTYWHYTRFTVF